MNGIQKIGFELLTEIDEICNKNHITYYLHADTAAMALKEGEYDGDYLSTAVEMTTQDAIKFMEYVEAHPCKGRALEHMGNYDGFSGFLMKYVNTDTLYLPLNYYDNYAHKGIGIQILFIRGHISNAWKRKLWLLLELGLEQNAYFTRRAPGKKEWLGKILVRAMSFFWKKGNMKKYLWRKWLKGYEYLNGEADIRKPYGKMKHYPARYFEEPGYVMFEGKRFSVFWDTPAHIKGWKGASWRLKTTGCKPSRELLVDERLSYPEFKKAMEKAGIDMEDFKRRHKQMKKGIYGRTGYLKRKNLYWEYAWNVKRNNIAKEEYADKEEYIQNLRDNEAYCEVFEELKNYDGVIRENIRYHYDRLDNPIIVNLYKDMLSVKGEKIMLANVCELEKRI